MDHVLGPREARASSSRIDGLVEESRSAPRRALHRLAHAALGFALMVPLLPGRPDAAGDVAPHSAKASLFALDAEPGSTGPGEDAGDASDLDDVHAARPVRVPPRDRAKVSQALRGASAPRPEPVAGPDRTAARPPVAKAVAAPPSPAASEQARRIRVRTEAGQTVVARVLGPTGGSLHLVLPDGQVGMADSPAYTDEPFVPATFDEVVNDLKKGPFETFRVVRTPHYVIAFQPGADAAEEKRCEAFAAESGRVLEDLYKGLLDAFRRRLVPVHDAEFPLVAVIFKTEKDFRAHKKVAPEIQAYYETDSNRIFFYGASERDEQAPEVAALRRPQTVAHEGTHQILQNVGVHPRLASWPPWLIEGLAEYCATPLTTRKGTTWSGLGMVNPLHLATIRDLNDPLSGQVAGSRKPEHIGRPPGMPLVEYLVKKSELTPTDYALAWAMTHYLAMKRVDPFLAFLKSMSAMPPLEPRTPDDHLNAFRAAFGTDLAKLDREIGNHLAKLKVNYPLPYYAVVFQQRVSNGAMLKKAAIVSQSPSMIRQWLDTVTQTNAEEPYWEVFPAPNRTRALVTAQEWMQGGQ